MSNYFKFSDVVSMKILADSGLVTENTLRINIRLLLRMALKHGYSMKKDIAEKMNEMILERKELRFGN